MLQLKNIVKTYVTGDVTQNALKGINRENEFVSILGQSGSGKTTMLNIIGGLAINGVSTKKYNDGDSLSSLTLRVLCRPNCHKHNHNRHRRLASG